MPAQCTLRDDYLAALLSGDSTRARWLIDQAVDDGVPVREVYLEVLQPTLVEIGERWAGGELSVAHEHYATSVTQGVMGVLAPRLRRPPDSGRLAVVACTPREQHELGAQMLAEFIESKGWEVLRLGASMPASDLVALVDDERPDVVALSTAVPDNVPEAQGVLRLLGDLRPRPFVVVGGLAWSCREDDAAHAGADACFTSATELVDLLDERFPALPEEG